MPLVPLELVPQPRHWEARFGSWSGNIFEVDPSLQSCAPILTSPDFELEANKLVTLCLSGYFGGGASLRLRIVERVRDKEMHSRLYKDVTGDTRMSAAFRAPRSGKYRLVLEHLSHPVRGRVTVTAPAFLAQSISDGRVVKGRVADFGPAREDREDERYLPHWNRLQRYIHRRCRASRGFNRFVAAVEMRLERQELLSLPQYMGLCPTGQCNATCDFCSVTINRTGIVKKQLPYERLENFVAPVVNTIQLFGIEGNGEPTLYTRFPELVERLTRGRANAYLITNGSRLKLDDTPLLLALEAVNFSLNAATAQTHQRVMKLKNFDEIVAVIRSLSHERGLRRPGMPREPSIYVTFVVTHDNVHEVQDFLRLAEQNLGADVVMVRPLAELGNELGAVEDLRRIVPYESDVQDMIESVREYVRDIAGESEIRLAPETFRSSRPDAVGRVAMPHGFEGRLLAPRRNDWRALRSDVDIVWSLNAARIMLPAAKEELLKSQPIPVEPGRELTFKAQVGVQGGPVRLRIVDSDDRVAADALVADTGGRMISLELQVQTGQGSPLSIWLIGEGRACTLQVDFERLRTPAPYVSNEFHIPVGRRWEICAPQAEVVWDESKLVLRSPMGGRPYLLKSYAVPCAQDTTIEIPVQVDVSRGAIEIGILDGSSASYLETFCFAEGQTDASVFFNTGANDAVRLVVSASRERPVEAAILWGKSHIIADESGEEVPIRLPSAPQWEICTPDAQVNWEKDALTLRSATGGRPYLLKSCAIRCAKDMVVEIPVRIAVSSGTIEIGILNASGQSYLQSFRCAEGRTASSVFFNTGANGAFRLVVSAAPDSPIDATIHWAQPRLARDDDVVEASLRLPGIPEWVACVPAVQVEAGEDRLSIAWSGAGNSYLLKSNNIRCRPGRQMKALLAVKVSEGSLGVGVLDARGAAWLTTQTLAAGTHRVELNFSTGANDQVSLVLFAAQGAPIRASLSFSEHGGADDLALAPSTQSERAEEWALTEAAPRQPAIAHASAIDAPGNGSVSALAERATTAPAESATGQIAADIALERRAPASIPETIADGNLAKDEGDAHPDRLFRQVAKWARGGTRYYCQKPWTDMSNFTVDGRMDVCCIATGASQEAYQLGNINRHSFQESWNGPMARKFRRTVNTDNKLPPCARCPMSHAYSGLLFDPEYTLDVMNVKVFKFLRKLGLRGFIGRAASINQYIARRILFGGFKSQRNRTI